MKPYVIHKPTHELLNAEGQRFGILQTRFSDFVCVNLVDGRRAIAIGFCAYYLIGYGMGTNESQARIEALASALAYLFGGRTIPEGITCNPIRGV